MRCIIPFLADSVERPPSDRQCEEHRSKGQQSDGAHEAEASTWHHDASGNGNGNRSFIDIVWFNINMQSDRCLFYSLGLNTINIFYF